MNNILTALIATIALASPAHAAFNSSYSDLDLDQCLVLDADDFTVSWSCPGYKGYPLMVKAADLRYQLGYGFHIDSAYRWQTVPPVNELGGKLEWRLSNALGRWMPIATITPYFTADPKTGKNDGRVLVVTQLVEGNTCHIAYVDAVANSDAIALARTAADASGTFDCDKDKIKTIGKFAAW